MKVAENKTQAKAEMGYLIREARHMGVAMGLDTQRYKAVDIDIRSTIDYLFFKCLGIDGLPRDLHWVYRFFTSIQVHKYIF